MYMRKQYAWPGGKKPEGWTRGRDPMPPVDYISIGHTGGSKDARQLFAERIIHDGQREGWLTIADGKITLKSYPEELVYTIIRGPGLYCCHCGAELGSSVDAAHHITTEHRDKKSPSRENPSGYRRNHGYWCELDADQHERYRKKNKNRHTLFPVKTQEEANG